MEGVEHKTLSLNGISMHVAEMGHGPIILFLHGFPQCWYSWRHQMTFFARHGYRALAPDLRGYADTTGVPPSDPAKFTTLHVVGDIVALIDAVAPADDQKVLVWATTGAMVAWALCLYRPDKVKALVNMSVAFTRRNPSRKPLEMLRAVYGDDYYICRFQEPGAIEHEFAQIVSLPPWLSEEDVDYYTSKYNLTGFTAALNYYRALDIVDGAQVKVPVKFIVGDVDLTYNAPGSKEYIHKGGFKRDVPLLKEVVVMEGVGHFINEEKPDEVNAHIHSFFNQFSSSHCSAL
ncbi:Epoxide hydrolase B [Sesamum angolense]|uniref:Epoxide hydrolase B n=1 Tax=Sesamum angolense TaxID=2727404 RepID=A0AAE1X654_9LAMI|nr:Epoxide hydrolase B [Sesamum angolense]